MSDQTTGAALAGIKAATGMTWDQLAGVLGASSGDYVRKVASGAKPGRNLDGAVRELMTTGRVERAPERRRDASGLIAKVRAPLGGPARRPSENAVKGGEGRQLFRAASGRLGWTQSAGKDGADLRRLAASAGRGKKRMTLRVTVRGSDGRRRTVTLGSRGGYRAASIPRKGDLGAWLLQQMTRQTYALADGGEIEDVEVIAE